MHGVDLNGRGLEIGPSYSPLVPKSSDVQVDTVDHAPREELVEKYRALGLDEEKLAKIDEVDFLWNGGSLLNVVPEHGAYDYIIASHFIEHTVDLIGFLQDCQALLKPTGRVALVVPDKRYTFDYFKPLSSLGTVIESHLQPTRFHPPQTLIDQVAYSVHKAGDVGWVQGDLRPVEMQHVNLLDVPAAIDEAVAQQHYVDRHRWVFTPGWFELLIRDLAELGYTDLEVVESFPTEGIEFFATLARSNGAPSATDRLESLSRVDDELASASLRSNLHNVDHLRVQNALLRQEVELLRASTSWRVTRPMRAISSRLRRRP